MKKNYELFEEILNIQVYYKGKEVHVKLEGGSKQKGDHETIEEAKKQLYSLYGRMDFTLSLIHI